MKPGRDRGLADVERDCRFAVGETDHVDGRDGVTEVGRQGGDRPIHVAGRELSLWLRDARIRKQLHRVGLVDRLWPPGRRAASRDERVAQHGQEVREVVPGAQFAGLFQHPCERLLHKILGVLG